MWNYSFKKVIVMIDQSVKPITNVKKSMFTLRHDISFFIFNFGNSSLKKQFQLCLFFLDFLTISHDFDDEFELSCCNFKTRENFVVEDHVLQLTAQRQLVCGHWVWIVLSNMCTNAVLLPLTDIKLSFWIVESSGSKVYSNFPTPSTTSINGWMMFLWTLQD